jgi:hypothetical protein
MTPVWDVTPGCSSAWIIQPRLQVLGQHFIGKVRENSVGADNQGGNRRTVMTTVQITLPDELAQKAASAGLLSAEAMEAMLREQLRRRAGEALQAMWQRGPQEVLTAEVEQEIVQQVHQVRAQQRRRGAS